MVERLPIEEGSGGLEYYCEIAIIIRVEEPAIGVVAVDYRRQAKQRVPWCFGTQSGWESEGSEPVVDTDSKAYADIHPEII